MVLAATNLDADDERSFLASIGSHLGVSRATVKWHLNNAYAKLQVVSMVDLIKKLLMLPGHDMDIDAMDRLPNGGK